MTGAQPPVQDPGAAPGQTPGRHRKVGATVLYSVTCPDLADVGWFHLRGYGHMASDRHLADLLGDFVRTIAGDFPLEAVLAHLTERVLDVVPVTGAGVTLISAGVNPHTLAASDDRARHFEELQTTLNEGPCLAAWESGLAVAVPDLRLDDRFPVFATQALEAGLGGVFTFPIRRGGRSLLRQAGPALGRVDGGGPDPGRRGRGLPVQRPGPHRRRHDHGGGPLTL